MSVEQIEVVSHAASQNVKTVLVLKFPITSLTHLHTMLQFKESLLLLPYLMSISSPPSSPPTSPSSCSSNIS